MICPKCATKKMRAVYTIDNQSHTKRVRRCSKCSYVMNSIEIPIFEDLTEKEIKEYEEYIGAELADIKKMREKLLTLSTGV